MSANPTPTDRPEADTVSAADAVAPDAPDAPDTIP